MTSNFWKEKIKFGTLEVPRFMAAPLDGITDSPFRQIMREFSPNELLMTEMRHISQVANERSERSINYSQIEHPLAFQFSGNSLKFLPEAVEKVINSGFVMINLNSGCPAKVVIRSGSGSALMANLPLLKELIVNLKSSIGGRVPFTLKMRAGFKEKNALEVATLAQELGIEGIIIHPRTQPEGFVARLDYDLVKKMKESAAVPIIFSGNINSFEHAKKVYELTGVDGFMIGRALWGAPWKIKEMTEAAEGKNFSIDALTALQYGRKHLDLSIKFYGDRGFSPFKKQLPQYIRNVPEAAQWRFKLLRTQTKEEMESLFNELQNQISLNNGNNIW
jgi:tRNA-dihydrouridine synthase B